MKTFTLAILKHDTQEGVDRRLTEAQVKRKIFNREFFVFQVNAENLSDVSTRCVVAQGDVIVPPTECAKMVCDHPTIGRGYESLSERWVADAIESAALAVLR